MKTSLNKYRRLGAEDYAVWACSVNGIEHTEEFTALDIHATHALIAEKLKPVEIVEEVAEEPVEVVEEVVEEVEEVVEEVVEEEVEEEPLVVAPVSDNPFPQELQMYDSLTVAELRDICKERGLPVYGTKAEIILRLKQNDEGINSTEESDSPTEEVALEDDSEAPTEEVAASIGEEQDEQSSSEQEPVIEERPADETHDTDSTE